MDLKFLTSNALVNVKHIHRHPISWIGGLQGAMRGLVT